MNASEQPTAAQRLMQVLSSRGVQRVYSVPGESFLSALDASLDTAVEVVTCRHEGAAGFMALAEAKLTERAGVCIVNRGPGATNAAIAIHSAQQDANPLVLIVGHVCVDDVGRRAFQEVDYSKTFSDLAKGVFVVYQARRIAELTVQAFQLAESGTPGPTVLVIPENVLDELVELPDVSTRPTHPMPHCGRRPLERVLDALAQATRPLLIAGGRLASRRGREALLRASEAHNLPVLTSNKHQDLFPNRHPNYAGHLNIATQASQIELLQQADLCVAVGTRLDDITTQNFQYPRLEREGLKQSLIHVYPDPQALGRPYYAELALACDPVSLLEALANAPAREAGGRERSEWTAQLHASEVGLSQYHPVDTRGVDFGRVVTTLSEHLESDAVIAVDAGNFTSWVHRYFRFHGGQELLGIASSAMGFGVPSAIAAALCFPGRRVVSFVGDGGFLMTGTELATACRYRLPLTIVVANNASYGTIRHHQERRYPGRVVATDLTNPDFVAMAQAFGARGYRIEHNEQVQPVVLASLERTHDNVPIVLQVNLDISAISAYQTLSALAV